MANSLNCELSLDYSVPFRKSIPEQTKFDKTQIFSVVHSSTDFCRGNRVIDDVALSCPIGKGFCCCQITVGFPFSL